MKYSLVLLTITASIILQGCDDKSSDKKLQPTAQLAAVHSKVLFPKSKESITDKQAVTSTLPHTTKTKSHAPSQTKSTLHEAVKRVEKVQEKVKKAKFTALEALETLDLEEANNTHGDASKLHEHKKAAADTIIKKVHEVKAAQAAAAATIAASVNSVEAARAATNPRPAISIEALKEQEKGKIAHSMADVEEVKADAAVKMSKSIAVVEMNKRLYGEDSKELADAKAVAAKTMAESVGAVKVAQADALAKISQSVAAVEVAKAQMEIISDDQQRGQKIYEDYLQKRCGMTGRELAEKHTQTEWEELRNVESFVHEVHNICPHVENVKKEWVADLYAYIYAHGKKDTPSQ